MSMVYYFHSLNRRVFFQGQRATIVLRICLPFLSVKGTAEKKKLKTLLLEHSVKESLLYNVVTKITRLQYTLQRNRIDTITVLAEILQFGETEKKRRELKRQLRRKWQTKKRGWIQRKGSQILIVHFSVSVFIGWVSVLLSSPSSFLPFRIYCWKYTTEYHWTVKCPIIPFQRWLEPLFLKCCICSASTCRH